MFIGSSRRRGPAVVWCFALFCSLALVVGFLPPKAPRQKPVRATLSFKDMIGQSHAWQAAPHRIVFTANIMPAFATLAGNLDSIVGATELGRRGMKSALLDRIFPGSDQIASAGGNAAPNLEEIMRLTPDAVFGWSSQKEAIGDIGPFDFVNFNTPRPLTPSHIALWQSLGILTGHETKAGLLLQTYKDKIDSITARMGSSAKQSLRVLVLISNGDRIGIGPPRQYLDERLDLVGAKNAVQSRLGGLFSIEDVARLDPDVILIQSSSADPQPEELFNGSVWQMIRAVRERKVYRVPDLPLFTVPVFDPLLVEWLAEVFHPEVMPHSLRQSFREAYREVYHHDLTDDEIDQALFIKENSASAGYQRFSAEQAGP